ncbi:Hypothetical predicted protein [Paramuricea clavata]|uniref:Uncharacterized protein n=1 Tax=Paramuricea clavata TaxID=317549 RepID=A0A6S7HE61_PARCT|nr:Hypothetical predicted protein [Paramuricea clavata]
MTSCGFKSLVSSPCGSSKYQKQASESIILLKCTKDIKGNLKRLNTYDSNLKKETTLILAGTGVFDVDESHLHLTICPCYRDEYAICKRCRILLGKSPSPNTSLTEEQEQTDTFTTELSEEHPTPQHW